MNASDLMLLTTNGCCISVAELVAAMCNCRPAPAPACTEVFTFIGCDGKVLGTWDSAVDSLTLNTCSGQSATFQCGTPGSATNCAGATLFSIN